MGATTSRWAAEIAIAKPAFVLGENGAYSCLSLHLQHALPLPDVYSCCGSWLPHLTVDAPTVPVDDFFGDYVEQLGARGLQQDEPMNGENAGPYKSDSGITVLVQTFH